MIFDYIGNLHRYDWLCKDIDAILELLKDESLQAGEYPISEQAFVVIQEYETREATDIKFEAHRVHADIQIMLAGEEVQYYAKPQDVRLSIPFTADNDICFFTLHSRDSLQSVHLKTGDITIYLPGECHAPCYDSTQKSKVKKAIVKVKY